MRGTCRLRVQAWPATASRVKVCPVRTVPARRRVTACPYRSLTMRRTCRGTLRGAPGSRCCGGPSAARWARRWARRRARPGCLCCARWRTRRRPSLPAAAAARPVRPASFFLLNALEPACGPVKAAAKKKAWQGSQLLTCGQSHGLQVTQGEALQARRGRGRVQSCEMRVRCVVRGMRACRQLLRA